MLWALTTKLAFYCAARKIQVLDLPGIIEGAAHGAGRGKEVIAVARSADAILIVLDAGKEGLNRHREILEQELETVGIRLNQRPPDVTVTKRKTGGGIKFASTVPQTKLGPEPEKVVAQILREYKLSSADVLAREEITVDQLVDVAQGNREYKPCLYLYNKVCPCFYRTGGRLSHCNLIFCNRYSVSQIDTITIEEIDQLARQPHSIVGSVHQNLNIGEPHEDDYLKQKMWEYLGLTRIYTKRKGSSTRFRDLGFLYRCADMLISSGSVISGAPPDLEEPVILSDLRKGTRVKSLCANISSELLRDFNYAVRFSFQSCSLFPCLGGPDFDTCLSSMHRFFNDIISVKQIYDCDGCSWYGAQAQNTPRSDAA
jgi:uncharacterized protein